MVGLVPSMFFYFLEIHLTQHNNILALVARLVSSLFIITC